MASRVKSVVRETRWSLLLGRTATFLNSRAATPTTRSNGQRPQRLRTGATLSAQPGPPFPPLVVDERASRVSHQLHTSDEELRLDLRSPIEESRAAGSR